MSKPLVSIVIPCYNGEKHLAAFLDSISNQTYTNLQIIFINDGSSDQSEKIFLKWRNENTEKFIINYIYQTNKGQAFAVSEGLQYVAGEFLMWCDCDDILFENNVMKKLNEFSIFMDLDLVFCSCVNVNEKNAEIISTYKRKNPIETFFEDLILERNVHYCPAMYMIKSSTFFKKYPNRRIFSNRGGQNWQMLLPVVFDGNVKYIDEVLVRYSVSQHSHSKNIKNLTEILTRMDEHKEILLNVINLINMDNIGEYKNMIEQKYFEVKFKYSIKYDDKEKAAFFLLYIERKKILYKLVYFICKMKIFSILYDFKNRGSFI